MSKLRSLLGGLAAIGTLAVLAAGFISASTPTAHASTVRVQALAASPACYSCAGGVNESD